MQKKNLLIFGNGEIADLANFYFSKFTNYDVAGFVIDDIFYSESIFCGKPIIKLSEIKEKYSTHLFTFFVALAYKKANQVRKEKYEFIKKMGYSFASFLSPSATILNNELVGDNCFILENNVIQPYVKIGDNVTLWSGNHVGHHSTIGNHCFVSSHVVISGGVTIGEQVFLGVNSTIKDHIEIGEKSIIGAGCCILKNVEKESIYFQENSNKSRISSTKLR